MKYYIASQKERYFSQDSNIIRLKITDVKELCENEEEKINIFLYDRQKSKIYGPYEADLSEVKLEIKNLENENNEIDIYIKKDRNRRGIYFKNEKMKKDNSIFELDEKTIENISYKISTLNKQMPVSFLDVETEEDSFYISYREVNGKYITYWSKRKIKFDKNAFNEMYLKYITLIENPVSEYRQIEEYISLGTMFTNMFMPFKDLIEVMTRKNQIIYLDCDKYSSLIPWSIFAYKNKFFSDKIIFSNMYAKDTLCEDGQKKKTTKLALISIPQKNLKNAGKEIAAIEKLASKRENIEISVYKKNMSYTEFVDMLEEHNAVHIITHGNEDGILLSEDYTFKSTSLNNLMNPPDIVFLSACNHEENSMHSEKSIVSSLLQSGVKSVIAAKGPLLDKEYSPFVYNFYNNYLQPEKNIDTALAYHFAIFDEKDTYSFLRYNFFGGPAY